MKVRYILCAAVMMAIVGCFKEEVYNTTLVVRPYQELTSGADETVLSGVVAYAFATDTTTHKVLSYSDAVAGVVVSKETGEQLLPIATATSYTSEDLEGAIAMQIEQESVMLVVADEGCENYAYSNYDVGLNLPTTYITLTFRPYKTTSFIQGKWQYIVPETTTE